jgi:hypothetical protein
LYHFENYIEREVLKQKFVVERYSSKFGYSSSLATLRGTTNGWLICLGTEKEFHDHTVTVIVDSMI